MKASTLLISLKSSPTLVIVLSAVHACGAIVLWSVPMPLWIAFAMTLLIALSAWHSVRRHALLNFSSAVKAIKLSDDGDIEVQTTGGNTHAAKLGVEQFVNSRLTILSYRRNDRRWTRHVVIVVDMLDADLFRQLRMRLKWRR